MMELMIALYITGLFGSLGMDLISPVAERLGYRTGVTIPLIGRWFIALLKGQMRHTDIRSATPYQNETLVGWLFHYVIGGGAVALMLLVWLWFSGQQTLPASPYPYLLFGLLTSGLPWLILMPAFGWGLFGQRGPHGTRPLIASPLNHLGYGIGIWLSAEVMHSLELIH